MTSENDTAEARLAADRCATARQFQDMGHFEEAAVQYRRIIEEFPTCAQAWRCLAKLLRNLDRREEGAELLRVAAPRFPDDPWILHDFADGLREWGMINEAQIAFQELIEKFPDFAQGWRGLAFVARAQSDMKRTIECCRNLVRCNPDEKWFAHDLANALRDAGQWDEADAVNRQITERHPDFFQGWRGLGQVAREKGDREHAIAHFRAAAKRFPQNLLAAQDLANELTSAGRLEEAEAEYRRMTREFPEHVEGWRGFAQIARARGAFELAVEIHRRASQQFPENLSISHNLADAMREAGQLDDAEAAFHEITRRDPGFALGWRGLAFIAREQGRMEQALAFMQQASRNDPRNLWYIHDLVALLRNAGHLDQARTLAEQTALEHKESSLALMIHAQGLGGLVEKEEIIDILLKAVASDRNFVPALLALANEYLANWRLDEADEAFRRVQELQDKNVGALMGRTEIARRSGRNSEVLELLSQAADADPGNQNATIELARELSNSGQYERAVAFLEKALAQRPGSLTYRMQLGQIAREAGKFDVARDHYSRIAAIEPNCAPAQIELAIDDFRRGEAAHAISRLESFSTAHPNDIGVIQQLAEFYERIQQLETALALRCTVLEKEPTNLRAYLETANLQSATGSEDDAEQTLLEAEKRLGPLPDLALRRAEIAFRRGKKLEAREIVRNARRAWPMFFDLWMQEILDATETGAFYDALKLLAAPPFELSVGQAAQCQIQRGHILAAQWRTRAALSCYVKAAKHSPAKSAVYEHAAKMALIDADTDTAGRYLALSKQHDATHLARFGAAKPSQSHIGQLLDEYRLDRDALTRLRSGLAANEPAELARLTLDRPEYTPAAIGLLLALRRTGRLSLSPNHFRKAVIPKNILQFWDRVIPADVAQLCDGWRTMNPDYAYKLYDDAEARVLVAQVSRAALDAFDRCREPAAKSDIFRLAALILHGGCYVDADDRCLGPLEGIEGASSGLVLSQEDFGTVANNFIAAVPDHPILRATLEDVIQAVNRGDNDMIWLATGPGALTRNVGRFLAEDTDARLKTLALVEPWQLRRHIAPHCAVTYKQTDKHWLRASFRSQLRRK